ncbi:MAG: DNA polymerase III subunit delta, partial [Brachymonas denitrificans]
MQVSADQLPAQLKNGVRSLYVVHGNEPLLVQEAVDAIRAAARGQGFSERSSHTVTGVGFDWGTVLAATQSLSLFAEKQIVEIHIPSGKPGKDGSQALQQIAEASAGNDALLVVVTLPRLDKATKSSGWFVALEGHGVSVPVESVERQMLPRWIAARLRLQGQQVAAGAEGEHALRFFADRVEGNLLAAHQEIQKLGLLYPHGELSAEQIEAAVLNVARYDVFKLSEAVLAGQMERTQRMLDGLQ